MNFSWFVEASSNGAMRKTFILTGFICIGSQTVFLVQFGINCTSEFFKKLKLL